MYTKTNCVDQQNHLEFDTLVIIVDLEVFKKILISHAAVLSIKLYLVPKIVDAKISASNYLDAKMFSCENFGAKTFRRLSVAFRRTAPIPRVPSPTRVVTVL